MIEHLAAMWTCYAALTVAGPIMWGSGIILWGINALVAGDKDWLQVIAFVGMLGGCVLMAADAGFNPGVIAEGKMCVYFGVSR